MGDSLIALNKAGEQHLADLAGMLDDPDGADDVIIPSDDPIVIEVVRDYLAHGQVSVAELDAYGRRCGVTGRTMRNRLNRTLDQMREAGLDVTKTDDSLTPDMLEIIAAHSGRIAPAYQAMVDRGMNVPSQSTVHRRWDTLDAAYRGFIRKGKAGLLESWAYVAYTAPYRNAVWQGDFVELPVDVIPEGWETKTVKPWLLIFEDDHTRAATCWSLQCQPKTRGTGPVVAATLAAGYEGTDIEGVFVGGLPEVVRIDNDQAFLSQPVDALAAATGNEIAATPPYSPFMKGKVERLCKTVQDECIALMQGYTHGPLSYTGRNPFRDGGPITEATLRRFLEDWFHHYNTTRVHSRLDHGTPLRQWAADTQPIRHVPPATLRDHLMPVGKDHKVHKDGVWWDGGYWIGPGITKVTGRDVTFRYPLRPTPDRIEIFHKGTWALTAWRTETITTEQWKQISNERRAVYNEAIDTVERAATRRSDATAEAAEEGGVIRIADAPDGDVFGADLNDLWDLVGDPTPDDEDARDDQTGGHTASGTKRKTRRAPRTKPASRRRTERPDDGPDDDLWGLLRNDEPPEDDT